MRRTALPFSMFVLLGLFASAMMQTTEGKGSQTGFCEKQKPCQLLTQAEAEKILGQLVRLTQNTSERKGDVRQCSCSYMAVAKNPVSGQDTHLYFAVEQREENPSAEQAHQVLQTIKEENAHDQAIIDLSGIADEAFLLGDSPSRPFIMARKGAVVIRLQVRETANKESLESLKAFARAVAARL
jgi:hypothetical protein